MGPSPRHIETREATKVAGETWQRSRRTSPAAGSYVQPCDVSSKKFSYYNSFATCFFEVSWINKAHILDCQPAVTKNFESSRIVEVTS